MICILNNKYFINLKQIRNKKKFPQSSNNTSIITKFKNSKHISFIFKIQIDKKKYNFIFETFK